MSPDLVSILLAAGPKAAAAAQPEQQLLPGEPATGFYILLVAVLVPTIAKSVLELVQWMGRRTLQREDQDKEEIRTRLKEHDKRFEDVERSIDELKASNERRFSDMDHALVTVQAETKQVLNTVEAIRGAVVELKTGLENRFEKQADFYRSSLKEHGVNIDTRLGRLEQDLRHDMTRAIADSLREPAPPTRKRR